ncbi:MAG: hypothetical protein ACFFA6_00340 [Promethearchaeota archaeon]
MKEYTINEIQLLMNKRLLSTKKLTEIYLNHIFEIDKNGSKINATLRFQYPAFLGCNLIIHSSNSRLI